MDEISLKRVQAHLLREPASVFSEEVARVALRNIAVEWQMRDIQGRNRRVAFAPYAGTLSPVKSKSLRARVIAEWRGLPEIPFVRETSKPIIDPLTKVMASLGLKDRLKEEEVLRAWGEIAGDFISKHSSPQRLKDGVLTVRVLQPTVHYELDRVWKRDLLAKLKARFGSKLVREIRFRIG